MAGPSAWSCCFLTGVGPLIAWRRPRRELRRQFTWPDAAGLSSRGGRPPRQPSSGRGPMGATDATGQPGPGRLRGRHDRAGVHPRGPRPRCARARRTRCRPFGALLRKNQQRYGGYIVHLGMVFDLDRRGRLLPSTRSVLENVKPGDGDRRSDYRLDYLTARPHPRAALRRRRRAHRALPRRRAPRRSRCPGEAHVLAGAAAGLDPLGVLDAATRICT